MLNKRDTIRLKPFRMGKKEWEKGVVHKRLDEQSYEIETPSGTFRKNRIDMRKTSETPPELFQAPNHTSESAPALSQSGGISPDFCCFYGGGIRHNEDIMHSFQNFIVRLIPNHPPPLETRIWKLVVRALVSTVFITLTSFTTC